jgi:alkylation response protein AidB-like acyl-CoA dehydrogenase
MLAQIEAQAAAIDGIAYAMEAGEDREPLLARALAMRFTAQGVIESVAMRCAEMLGGMAFMESPDVAYLLAACRAMAFHPPGRLYATRALDQYSLGGSLDLT